MDRTIIPNGSQPEHPEARTRFRKFCQHPEVTLVYVTGRHRALVEQAIADYQLPAADYAITASADALDMNGNYSAGVLQGVWHFAPGFRDLI